MGSTERGAHKCSACSSTTRGRTPTQDSHSDPAHRESGDQGAKSPNVVYIVTDTCYPMKSDFADNKGRTAIFSVHSTKEAANARAKKIIYENEGACTVDIDKVIEEKRLGLYTGIGIGDQEEKTDCCYARKCEVESKTLDEDSEDESGDSNDSVLTDGDHQDEDVEMG